MIDGGVFLGRNETNGEELEASQLVAMLDELGVRHALTLSYRSIWHDDREGNRDCLKAAQAWGGRLLPVAVINLLRRDPFDGYLANLREQGFAAAAFVSSVFGWTLDDYAFRNASRDLAAVGMPLQVCVREKRDLAAAANGAGPFGGTVMLRWMRGGGYANLADLLAIGKDFPAFLFDISTVTQSGAVELLVERLGPQRLFVASGMPQNYARSGWYLLEGSGLDSETKQLIAGGNLARVMGLPQGDGAQVPADWKHLVTRPKIDTHWHTGSWNMIEPRLGFDDLSRTLDRYHMRLAITSSVRALSDDLGAGNRETAAFLDVESRARGLIVVNPLQPERSKQELERWRNDSRFVGVKTIQDFYGLRLDADQYRPILDLLSDMPGWPIMAHLPGLKEAAAAYPTVQFVAAHSTWRHRELGESTNVWFDIATSTPGKKESDIGDLIDVVGIDRVLFSSDAPLIDPAFTIAKLASLNLPAEALDAIFADNALRAFPRLALVDA